MWAAHNRTYLNRTIHSVLIAEKCKLLTINQITNSVHIFLLLRFLCLHCATHTIHLSEFRFFFSLYCLSPSANSFSSPSSLFRVRTISSIEIVISMSMFDCVYYSRMHIAHGSSRNEKFSATQYGNIAPEDFRTAHLRRGVCTFFVGFLVQNVCVHQLKIHSIIWLTIWNLFYVLLVCATRKIRNLFRWKFSFCIILQR